MDEVMVRPNVYLFSYLKKGVKSMNNPNNCSSRGDKIIRLPITELEYTQFNDDKGTAKEKIDALYCFYPELFPRCFSEGYTFT